MINHRLTICGFTLFLLLGVTASAQDSEQWQTKGKYEYRVYKLKPTDWPQAQPVPAEKCAMTPDQASKYQCKTVTYQGRLYFYYEGEHGNIYARRPVVHLYETPGAPVSK